MTDTVGAVIVAAGSGTRMAGADKLFTEVGGRSLLAHAVAAFEQCSAINRIVLVLSEANLEQGRGLVKRFSLVKVAVVPGGARRQDSVRLGLEALGECDYVAIHDGARPLVTSQLIERGIEAARDTGAAVPALPLADTVKEAGPDSIVLRTLDRSRLWAVQTPQVFRYDLIVRAHREITAHVTDDAAMVEALGEPVRLFEGDRRNVKVTTVEDFGLVEALAVADVRITHSVPITPRPLDPPPITRHPVPMRAGIGYDIHRFEEGRPFVLGGIKLPGETGLAGHSDSDVLLHAIIDALLGAAGLGDIGQHFPPDDPQWKDASSLDLLARTVALVGDAGLALGNVDATVIAERPRLAPHIPAIRQRIAEALGVDAGRVNVKATTNEGIGAIGRGEAIAAMAVALLTEVSR
jgi:2-C-methyl-D-erythritol 4-phosphate cytidylyltransferase/2-C-methyl-D-erythritol 2,4-cyclodiphosphate synthase